MWLRTTDRTDASATQLSVGDKALYPTYARNSSDILSTYPWPCLETDQWPGELILCWCPVSGPGVWLRPWHRDMWHRGQHYSSHVTIKITQATSVFRQILLISLGFYLFDSSLIPSASLKLINSSWYKLYNCLKRYESNCWLDSGSRDRFFFAVFSLIFVFISPAVCSAVTNLTQINNLSPGRSWVGWHYPS